MKKILYLLVLVFFLSSCIKDHDYEPVDYSVQMHITGKLIDAQTQEPLPNIPLQVENTGLDAHWNWYFVAVARDITHSDGTFRMDFKLDGPLHLENVHLKIDSILPDYQRGARINGEYNNVFCKIEGAGYPIEQSEVNYTIELFRPAKAYFVKPNIPTGWEQDTLNLKVYNLVESPNYYGWECLDIHVYPAIFEFRLNNTQVWVTDLKRVRNLFLGDKLDIEYTIKNGIVKKSGSFSKVCALGDTTAVELPLW